MPKPPLDPQKIVVFSGAGISAPSGLATFRGSNGLWGRHRIEDVGTHEAWLERPQMLLDFYNERRAEAAAAEPNAGHRALAELEQRFSVVVITQNVDDLHERAGSSQVIHLHGELRKARSTSNPSLVYDIGTGPLRMGDLCEEGSQMRPHIVCFGEDILNAAEARTHIQSAGRLIVVGTSLSVYPAAGLLKFARHRAKKVIVDLDIPARPYGFEAMQGSADVILPRLVERWLKSPV